MKKTITIIILLILMAILAIAFGARECINLKKQLGYLNHIEDQQERYLKNIEKWTENYNGLYADYNELNARYYKLAEDKGFNEDWETYQVTAYSLNDPAQRTNDTCAIGLNLETYDELPVIAVDPEFIELGSIIEIEGLGGFIALDSGGKIIGKHIDVLMDSKEEAQKFGIRNLKVRIIN